MKQLRLELPDEAGTTAAGAALARVLPTRAVVYLQGELGAGKSTLARGLLRERGVTGAIRSPTYTLLERYPLGGQAGEAWHLDLYRINAVAELDFLGLDDSPASLWLIEWPERALQGLPPADLVIELTVPGEGRRATLRAMCPAAETWLDDISEGGVTGHT